MKINNSTNAKKTIELTGTFLNRTLSEQAKEKNFNRALESVVNNKELRPVLERLASE